MREQASVDTCLGSFGAMTSGTVFAFTSLKGFACPMDGILSELRFLGDDQGGVIMALRAGQISS
jgi:hypothetical protein